jgi:hypothetical protein
VTTLTFSQIKAQVTAIRQKVADAQVIGIRVQGRWTGDRIKQDESETYLIEQCDSPLAMRLALRTADFNPALNPDRDSTICVLLTSLDESELSDDILLRLTKRRLYPIDGWQIVKTLFQANSIDPRLLQTPWIANYLMDWVSPAGYPAASGGFLDAETAWAILLYQSISFSEQPTDLLSILKWSIDANNVARFKAVSHEFREAATDWLISVAGSATKPVLCCVLNSARPDALAVGLALGVLLHPEVKGRSDRAIGKLEERYLAGAAIDFHTVSRWHQAAVECLQQFEVNQIEQILQRADQILEEVDAQAFAYLSDTSPIGFEQRLAQLGQCLVETLQLQMDQRDSSLEPLYLVYQTLVQHSCSKAVHERRRFERIEMAIRLMRWLTNAPEQPEPSSLAAAITYHQTEGGFVDWARLTLRSGDQIRELSEAYTLLFEQVTARREQQALQFATCLQNWLEVGTTRKIVLPVEQILDTIVAPLAAHSPVLVIVMDGMSMAVCRELVADITTHYWISLCQERQRVAVGAGLATVPSTTETSRTSLLCGQLKQGKSSDEKKGFATLPSFLAQCRPGFAPTLFHKDALREQDGALADTVRKAIASSQNRIVGVVINAIDDYLSKGDQIDVRWSQNQIKVLSILLHEARLSNRIVILLSDHGHILDYKTSLDHKLSDEKVNKKSTISGGERWRIDNGCPRAGELRVSGSRVLLPNDSALIAPWTERLRYRNKNNGYHGGLSPQEMIVPIAVLCSTTSYPPGWIEAPVDIPLWWEQHTGISTLETLQKLESIVLTEQPSQPVSQASLGPLFTGVPEAEVPVEIKLPNQSKQPAQWIIDLLNSPIYKSRKKVAGRNVPGDNVLAKILLSIDNSGGKLTLTALSRIVSQPMTHVRSLLTILQRILNADGYTVISIDPLSDSVKLDRFLLEQQFSNLTPSKFPK